MPVIQLSGLRSVGPINGTATPAADGQSMTYVAPAAEAMDAFSVVLKNNGFQAALSLLLSSRLARPWCRAVTMCGWLTNCTRNMLTGGPEGFLIAITIVLGFTLLLFFIIAYIDGLAGGHRTVHIPSMENFSIYHLTYYEWISPGYEVIIEHAQRDWSGITQTCDPDILPAGGVLFYRRCPARQRRAALRGRRRHVPGRWQVQ